MAAHQHDHDCGCHTASSSVHQTLDEMEFDRGLWSAALSGQEEDVKKRLDKGDDVNAKDKSGYTALHYAARSGHLQVCRLLLSHGSDVNSVTNTGQATPLHRAAYMGHHDLVKLLLQHKADPLATDADFMTPLHKAAERGHRKSAKILLNAAPKGKLIKDFKSRTPADLADHSDLKTLLS
ncbi:hypothetical protein V1264_009963 [Littorina saxatilis]|uniref:Ankyrin repeat domain-containing protein 39 n=1 Tax=Littorina saxatilis TaxID=31220 RepID=A0AAN9FZW7_9CAEN